MKKPILLYIFLSIYLLTYGAKMPQKGYVGPYDIEEESEVAYFWDGLDDVFESEWRTERVSTSSTDVPDGVCPDCVEEYFESTAAYYICIDALIGPDIGGYCVCTCSAFPNCPVHNNDNPSIGECILIMSLGNYFPLFVFALCYAGYYIRRKKQTILNRDLQDHP